MKQIVLKQPGGLEQLALLDAADPGAPGPGEIRVRVHANSLNFHDYAVVAGFIPTADGRIPMADGAGVVEAVGAGVEEFRAGDAVVSTFFPHWLDGPARIDNFAGTPGDGIDGHAREAVVRPATAFTRAPRDWSHAEAASSPPPPSPPGARWWWKAASRPATPCSRWAPAAYRSSRCSSPG